MTDAVVDGYEMKAIAKGGHSPDVGGFEFLIQNFNSDVQFDGEDSLYGPLILWLATGCSFSGFNFVTGVGTLTELSSEVFPSPGMVFGGCKKYAQGSCNGVFTLSSTPFTPYPCSCTLLITDAGQSEITIK